MLAFADHGNKPRSHRSGRRGKVGRPSALGARASWHALLREARRLSGALDARRTYGGAKTPYATGGAGVELRFALRVRTQVVQEDLGICRRIYSLGLRGRGLRR